MYKLTIIAVGGLKEPFWKEAVAEYKKRLRPFAKLRVIEVPDVPFKSPAEASTVLKSEAHAIRRNIPNGCFSVALDPVKPLSGHGASKPHLEPTSEEFAEFIRREGEVGRELCFLIGGPLGLDPDLVDDCSAKISLSPLTFTHGEARAVLFEQLYRAMTILSDKTYHY